MALDTLVVVLAGGEGKRLEPLTEKRLKPAVPVGGKYRLIDIPLSNAKNSNTEKIYVLLQGLDWSLSNHLQDGWYPIFGSSLRSISPQDTGTAFRGDADAVRQGIEYIEREAPEIVLVVPGDHLIKMDYSRFANFLAEHDDAEAAVAIIDKPIERAADLGSVSMDDDHIITNFAEKDADARLQIDNRILASMGIYAFRTEVLLGLLEETDANYFGRELFPTLIKKGKTLGYLYSKFNNIKDYTKSEKDGKIVKELTERVSDSDYWEDLGTIETYYNASMDLVGITPRFNLYGEKWPFYTHEQHLGPAKITRQEKTINDIICGDGAILSNVEATRCVFSPNVQIEDSTLEGVIVFNDTIIKGSTIRSTIIDKGSRVYNVRIGYDIEDDERRGIYIDKDSGIRVVRRNSMLSQES